MQWRWRVSMLWLAVVAPPSPTTPIAGSRSKQVPLDLLIVMVPFVLDESGRITGMLFQYKMTKLC